MARKERPMKRVRLRLKALSPITFAARRGSTSSFVDTLDYVPGTALRGAAAARYLREIGESEDETFKQIFLHNGVLFSNLYPVKSEHKIASFLPLTARSCKPHEGFWFDESKGHGVGDMLMRAAAFQMFTDYRLIDEIITCPRCMQQTRAFSGFYALHSPDHYSKVKVDKRHIAHVGINRKSQSAEHGFLFAQQVINEDQFFAGELIIRNDLYEFLLHTLLAKDMILWLGESRSRGLGRMQIVCCEEVESDTSDIISQRISKFNEQFATLNRRAGEMSFFSITLQSDAILTDAFMRPKAALDVNDVFQALNSDDLDLGSSSAMQTVYSSAGTRLVQSWNVASGYPKPDDVAITMGSVFLFKVNGVSTTDLAEPLAILQERGIGKRQSEGFGRLVVCDPFHWEADELWQAM